MSSNLGDLYQDAFKEYKKCNSNIPVQKAQANFNTVWKETVNKSKSKEEKLRDAEALLKKWREKSTTEKAYNLLKFFSKKPSDIKDKHAPCSSGRVEPSPLVPSEFERAENSDKNPDQRETAEKMMINSLTHSVSPSTSLGLNISGGSQSASLPINESSQEEAVDDPEEARVIAKNFETPTQDEISKNITKCQVKIQSLFLAKNAGLDNGEGHVKIATLKKKMSEMEKKLKASKQNAERQRKFRENRRKNLKRLCESDPRLAKSLKVRQEPGRPRLETDHPELLRVITELVTFGASAEERRRSEALRSCKSLSDLHSELQTMGFTISKSGTYLRLLPRNSNTNEGKKHVTTVPVRLKRAQTDLHKRHIDQHFCTATIRSIETVASILGPQQVIFLSQDDKARVPLGITAANKQAPILMHSEYQVKLPDHDWVVAERHKLVPSVYAGIIIKPDTMGRPDAVSYSGPTYIAIRSGKHSSSTASTHAADFERLLNIGSFKDIMVNGEGVVKPVVIMSVDGGPDENPRYPKVIAHAIGHFLKHDLDAIFIFTNAPGRSAYNRVERRMAPLSRELSGVILQHDHFGSHLSDSGKTIDVDLEKKNFEYAGNVLADIWSRMSIDGHDVKAEYIQPGENISLPDFPSVEWYANHVRESQYFLQVVKCNDLTCCNEIRSGLQLVLPNRFMPPPYSLIQTSKGPVAPLPDESKNQFASLLVRSIVNVKPAHDGFIAMPYDFYCPSVKQQLNDRACDVCGLYFTSKKGVKCHKKQLHGRAVSAASKIRPLRVVRRRAQELLCELPTDDGNVEPHTVAWVQEEDIDRHEEVTVSNETSTAIAEESMPIIKDIQGWTENPFEEDIDGS